jgi:hypothetical protein
MKKLLSAGVITLLIGGLAAGAHANLLINGSFETGDLTGWTQTGNTGFTNVTNSPIFVAEDGIYYVAAGPIGSDGMLSQTFADNPGTTLIVSGWLAGDGNFPSDFSMGINGITSVLVDPVPSQDFVEYTFTVQATGLDTFTVGFRNDPGFVGLDNFVIREAPEPASLALLSAGIAGLGLIRHRRKASSQRADRLA